MFLVGYVIPENKYENEKSKQKDTALIPRKDGIESNTDNEIIHVGRDGAYIALYIPLIDEINNNFSLNHVLLPTINRF